MYQKKQGWLLQCNTGTKAKNITFLTLCMNHTIMMSAKKMANFLILTSPLGSKDAFGNNV